MNNELKKHDRRWFVRGALVGAGVVLIVAVLRFFSPHLVKLGTIYSLRTPLVFQFKEDALKTCQLTRGPQYLDRSRLIRRLQGESRVRWVPQGTPVMVMDRLVLWEVPLAQVKVIEGPEKGYLGWVAQEDLVIERSGD